MVIIPPFLNVGGKWKAPHSQSIVKEQGKYLSKTFALGDRQKFTWAGFVTRTAFSGSLEYIFSAINSSNSDRFALASSGALELVLNDQVSATVRSNRLLRDVGTYHLGVIVDTTEPTAANRIKLMVNGDKLTSLSNSSYPSQNYNMGFGNNVVHAIGARAPSLSTSPGSIIVSDIHYLDGVALSESAFRAAFLEDIALGENTITAPKKVTGLTYGTNGYNLKFGNSSDFGEDSSGRGNDFAVTGFAPNDQITSVPGDPYAIISALNAYTDEGDHLSDGGLSFIPRTNDRGGMSTLPIPSSGVWYAEWTLKQQPSGQGYEIVLGVNTALANLSSTRGGRPTGYGYQMLRGNGLLQSAILNVMTTFSTSTPDEPSLGDTFSIVVDMDALTLDVTNLSTVGTLMPTISLPADTQFFFWMGGGGGGSQKGGLWNFGQRPWVGTPPAGALELRNSNKATPKYHGRDVFDVTLRADPNNSDTVSVLPWKPGFSWHKLRSGASAHKLFDMLRSPELGDRELAPDRNNAEGDGGQSCGIVYSDNGILFDTSVGSSNEPSALGSYVDWVWKLSDAPVLDTSGTLDANLAVAPEGHISAIQFQGTLTTGQTVPHGLPDRPEMKIIKQLGGANEWVVTHKALGANRFLYLDRTDAQLAANTLMNPDTDTSTLIGLGSKHAVNSSNAPGQIIYAFRSVPGLCKVGSFKGNGLTNGPFIYLGFRPRWIMFKSLASQYWLIIDTERDPENDGNPFQRLYANDPLAEGTYSGSIGDFDALGFKIWGNYAEFNLSGQDIIYLAMADAAGGGDLPELLAA